MCIFKEQHELHKNLLVTAFMIYYRNVRFLYLLKCPIL